LSARRLINHWNLDEIDRYVHFDTPCIFLSDDKSFMNYDHINTIILIIIIECKVFQFLLQQNFIIVSNISFY